MKRLNFTIVFLLVCFQFCSEDKTNPQTDFIFQSKYGNVSTKAFDELYTNFIAKSPFQDTYESKIEFLRQIYLNKGIAQKAKEEQIQLTVQDSARLEFYKMKLLTEMFWEKEIDAKMPEPTESELRETYKKMHTQLKVGNIFSTKKALLDSISQKIQNGEITFEEAAKEHYRNLDSTIAEKAGLDKYFSYGEMDFDFENAAYKLKKGQISEVFQSAFGYHLIKLISVKKDVFLQESDFQQRKDDIANSFKNRRNKNETDKFVRKQFAEKNVRIKTEILFKLKKYLYPYLKGEIDLETLRLNLGLYNELGQTSKDDILVNFSGQDLSVEEFMFYLSSLSYRIMKNDLLETLETVIEYKILSKMAIEKGFGENFILGEKVEIERERMLKNLFYQNRFAKIDTSIQSLENFFEKNKYLFTKNSDYDFVRFTSKKSFKIEDLKNEKFLFRNKDQIKIDTLKFTGIDRIPLIRDSGKTITFVVGDFLGEFFDESKNRFVNFKVQSKKEKSFQEVHKIVKDLYFEMQLRDVKSVIENLIAKNGKLKFSKQKLEKL